MGLLADVVRKTIPCDHGLRMRLNSGHQPIFPT